MLFSRLPGNPTGSVLASSAVGESGSSLPAQKIARAGSVASMAGPEDYFTGRVRLDMVYAANGDINASGGLVTFEPGARSAWHTHPKGQYLAVTCCVGPRSGVSPSRKSGRGDVIWCPPGVRHWHGAAPSTAMTHLAVTGTTPEGKNVEWMENVSDEQYGAR